MLGSEASETEPIRLRHCHCLLGIYLKSLLTKRDCHQFPTLEDSVPGMMNVVTFDDNFGTRKEIEWGFTMESREERGIKGRGLLYPQLDI